jgi:1-acylglycerone phosphate reductase
MADPRQQQVVLVTGCSQGGIGYALCQAFAKRGCRVFASARKLEAMRGLEQGFETLSLDVTDAASREAAVDAIISRAGRIDMLVNNAGIGLTGPIVETDLAVVKGLFETNFFGLLGEAVRL